MHDLWAHNLETASEAMGKTSKTSRRGPTEDEVLSSLRAWLLMEYAVPYCRSLAATRIFRRCFWIDALGHLRSVKAPRPSLENQNGNSHPSIFDSLIDSQQEETVLSPKATNRKQERALPTVLQPIVKLAGELSSESKPITLQGILLANDKRKAGFVLPKESAIVPGSWPEVAPQLLASLEQSASIFVLNPFATGSRQADVPFLPADSFLPLYQRTGPTELCLFISHTEVANRLLPALGTPAGASAFTALLKSDRWKNLLKKEAENRDEAVEQFFSLLIDSMKPHFLSVQRIAFPMLIGPATIIDVPYSLIFATRRQDSLNYMNDAVCLRRRRLEEQSHKGLLNEEWFYQQLRERRAAGWQEMKERVLQLGRAQNSRRWPDLRQQLLLSNFGQWTLEDYDEIIYQLLQEETLRCEWRQRTSMQSGNDAQRIPGNEDTLWWQLKKRRY
ncbi:MAG TPA: hypothetical protein VFA41_11695 [Ktedonobacteraceae bacterium]|jgi:hypothetical protein|nr:hypothetical protein [Ktedonobacteraceae bacterium]